MKSPNAAHVGLARQLLALEAGADGEDGRGPPAAGRVYEKLHAQLSPLVGVAGVDMLFVRSAKLTQGELGDLVVGRLGEGATKLRARLQAPAPALAPESATILFGTFFTLLTTLIGERLTLQILRRTWPMLDETPLPEKPR